MVALNRSWRTRAAALVLAALPAGPAAAQTVRGSVGVDVRAYPDAPLLAGQDPDRIQTSGSAMLTVSGDVAPARYDIELFGRIAPDNARRAVGDVRRATIGGTAGGGAVDWRIGVLSESWGVLEAWNPVDVINQRDLSEDFQGKAKLGQPGALATVQRGSLSITGFATTYARARRFPRDRDRQQIIPARVLAPRFEGDRWQPGFGARAALALGEIDIGVSQYVGPAREPRLVPAIAADGGFAGLSPRYDRIGQTSLDAQMVLGATVLKLEAMRRGGDGDYWGGGVGLERQLGHPFGLAGDLTAYAEFYYDDRGTGAPFTPFQRDLFVGGRYAAKDTHDSVAEVRVTHDLQWRSTLFELRASRRVFGDAVLLVDLILPAATRRDPALSGLRRDTNLRVGLTRYF